MIRFVFRGLVVLTLLVMYIARRSGGRMPVRVFPPFYYWFMASVFVFGVFGIIALVRAWREPQNRRAWLFDVMIAAAWVPYWFSNVR